MTPVSTGNGTVASGGGRSTPVTVTTAAATTTMMKHAESTGNLSTASGRSNTSAAGITNDNNATHPPSAAPYEVRSRTRSGSSAHSGRSSTPVSHYSVPSAQAQAQAGQAAAVAAPQASLMVPIGELLAEFESDGARGGRQRRYQEQQQQQQPVQPRAQPQPQPQDKAAAQSQRPGHNRKRTWSAPAGTVEHLMSTAAAAAAVSGGPAMTATAHNTPVKNAGDASESSSGGQGGSSYSRHYHGDLLSDSFGRSESYDDFNDDLGLGGGTGSRDRGMSGNVPTTPVGVVVEEADRGGGHGHGQAHHYSQGESSLPDILPSGAIDLGVGLGAGDAAAAASTPPRHYRRPRTLSDVGSLASRASPSMPRILHGLGYRLSRASPKGRHHSVDMTSPGEDAEPSFVNDEDADGNGGLAMPSLGVASNDRDDTMNDGSNRPRPSRDSSGRIRRSVSARTLINLGRLGGVETVLNGDRADTSASEPLNVDLQQIATAAVDAEDDMIADVAQTSMARQAADGGTSPEQETLVKELIAYFRYRPWKKKVLMLTVIGSVIWVVIDFATTGYIRSFLATFVSWMERNPVGGFFVFIIFFILTTLVFIPPSILTLGSGVAFSKAFGLGPGVVLAASSSFVGACIGAVIAFFRARYLMRDLIKLFARRYPVVKATDRAIKHKGFRIYLLLRMCPVIPFNALNYIGGITGVKWQAYTFALIGILPWQIVLVFIGATVGSVNNMHEDDQNSYNTVSITIGCVFSVISLLFMWYYARKELKREIAAHQEVEQDEEGRGGDVESQSNNSSASASLRNGSASNDPTGVSRRSITSLASLQGFSEFETESTADDGSVEEGEDEKWYWIWA